MPKILVCGSREWSDFESVRSMLSTHRADETVIIHGNCRGADKIAGYVGNELGMTVEVYPANWKKYGLAAGPIRNKEMLDKGKPDLVIAFHHNLESSVGTKDMITQAKRAGVDIYIYN